MIVVADTSPINYLVLIERPELLGMLYGRVAIPRAVLEELSCADAPASVRAWAEKAPSWLEVSNHVASEIASLDFLDRGERDAISLALDAGAERLIVDDALARQEAVRRGLAVIGTLGVLAEASQLGMLDLPQAIRALQATNFHVSDILIQRLREADRRM